jgi:hypothetical protein
LNSGGDNLFWDDGEVVVLGESGNNQNPKYEGGG